ncbi:adhesin protein [Pantoea phage Phynn]|nr:adhesin protein [Pantoea phage Phynn]
MKTMKTLLAVSVIAMSFGAAAHSTSPTEYDKTQDARISQNKADIDKTYAYVNTKYTESAGKFLEGQVKDLKADQVRQDNQTASNLKDQQVRDANQDKAIKAADDRGMAALQISQTAGGMAANAVQYTNQVKDTVEKNRLNQQTRDAEQDTVIQQAHEKADAGAVRMDGIEKQAGVLDGRVGATEVRADKLEQGQRDQNAQMESDRQQRVDGDAVNAKAIADESQTRDRQITKEASDRVKGDQLNARQIAVANQNIESGRKALATTNSRVDRNTATLVNHETRLRAVEDKTESKFRDIDRRFGHERKRTDAGISAAMAAANIPQVTEYQTFAVGAGVGTRGGETALSVGFSARASQNVVVKASIANDSQSSWTAGAGMSFGW